MGCCNSRSYIRLLLLAQYKCQSDNDGCFDHFILELLFLDDYIEPTDTLPIDCLKEQQQSKLGMLQYWPLLTKRQLNAAPLPYFIRWYVCKRNKTTNYNQIKSNQINMIKSLLILLSTLLLGQAAIIATLTAQDVDTLLNIMDRNFFDVNNPISLMKLVRIGFHDCVGGCDGSIDFNNPANNGLANTVNRIYRFYDRRNNADSVTVRSLIGRADWGALMASRAVGKAIQNSGVNTPYTNELPAYFYGRGDNAAFDNDNLEGTFPEGHHNWQIILNAMQSALAGISEADVVALLGLHGGGRLTAANSGFEGPWLANDQREKIGNAFYIALFGLQDRRRSSVTLQNNTAQNLQWVGQRGAGIRNYINADMHIYLNLNVDDSTGATSQLYYPQTGTTLVDRSAENSLFPSLSSNAQLGFSYAQDNTLYLTDVVAAFGRMLETPSEWNTVPLQQVHPQLACVGGLYQCQADVYLTNCGLASANVACS